MPPPRIVILLVAGATNFVTMYICYYQWKFSSVQFSSAFFDVRVCHPNADSYRELSPKQIFQLHENEKKRQYSRQGLEVEQGTFTPLVFTSTGGMADECKRFHSCFAELLALKKGDDYATTISWIRAKISFAILRSALLCLRGTRRKRRAANISDIDITSESAQARI